MRNEKNSYSQCPEGILAALNYNGGQIRMYYLNRMLWWALADVCRLIDLGNTSRAAARLDEYEKMTLNLGNSHSRQRGGAQKLTLINESGIYHLLLTSTKPEAKHCQRWRTTEVIPSVRQNGGYILGQDSMDAAELADAAKQVAQNVLSGREQWIQDLRLENEAKAALLREWEPKVRYHDAILQSQGAIPIGVIAKDYGFSAQWLNSYLHERRIQYKRAGTWLLYQPYANKGYTQTRTIWDGTPYSKLLTYWTQKGRAFLYDFLREDGILPLSERMNVSRDIEYIESL